MTHLLVIVNVLGGVVDRVQVVRRIPDETEEELLLRAKLLANEILDGSSFDPEQDSCTIHAVDPASGEAHVVWSMEDDGGCGDEDPCEEEEGSGD